MSTGFTVVDIDKWARKDHFHFFNGFHNPTFNICADVDVTATVARCRAHKTSFFATTLHAALRAANHTPEFRLRLRGEQVVRHDRIGVGATVLRDDETFAFAYLDFLDDREAFLAHAKQRIAGVQNGPHTLSPQDERDDLVHTSTLPWIRFTSITHARKTRAGTSVPKLVFGQHHEREGRRLMPVSVEAHHALVDGWHIAQFLRAFQEALDD